MSRHQLTDIRAAAVALLRTKFRRVYPYRWVAPAQNKLPCVVVSVASRSSSVFNAAPLELRHEAQLAVTCIVQGNEKTEDVAEEMTALAEKLFYANPTLGGELGEDLLPLSLTIEAEDQGEYVSVFYTQLWQAVWYEQAGDYVGDENYHPQAHIGPPLLTEAQLATHWQLYGSNPEIDAENHIPKS